MEYNSKREHLILPEYGRYVQAMVEHAITVADRDERNKMAEKIIQVMAQLNPSNKDSADYFPKLWDHLFFISDFKLDVDSPYPKPDGSKKAEKPKRLAYPQKKIKYRHYGSYIPKMIDKAIEWQQQEEKKALTEQLANLMKKTYLIWNRDSVNDNLIHEQLAELSAGKLSLSDDFNLENTSDILKSNMVKRKNNNKNKNNKQRKKNFVKR